MGFQFFKKRTYSRTHQQEVLSFSQAHHAGWPDIGAKVDLCVANFYRLAREIIDFSYFPTVTGL